MFYYRHKIVKAIERGDLEAFKSIIEDAPGLLNKDFGWNRNYKRTGLLHIAAALNQPKIAEFLVTKMDMNIDKQYYKSTALNYAASFNADGTIKTLLDLGANPCLKDSNGSAPYEVCLDKETKKLLYSAYLAREEKEQAEIVNPRSEEEEKEAAARVKGIWTKSELPDEIIFERELSGLRLTENFNFAAETRILIAENLKTGHLSQPETKSFSEIPGMVEQARVQRAKLQGDTGPEIPQRPVGDYGPLFKRAVLR